MSINYSIRKPGSDALSYVSGVIPFQTEHMLYHDGKVYAIYSSGVSYYIREYDIATGITTQHPTPSPSDAKMTELAYYNGYLYSLWDDPTNSYAFAVYKYELATQVWTLVTSSQRMTNFTVVGDSLYALYSNQHYRKVNLILENGALYTVSLPTSSEGMVAYGTTIYHSLNNATSLLKYDTTTDALAGSTSDNPYVDSTIRARAAQLVEDSILLWYDLGYDEAAEWFVCKYEIATDSWSELPPSIPKSSSFTTPTTFKPETAAVDGNIIYMREYSVAGRITLSATDIIEWKRL